MRGRENKTKEEERGGEKDREREKRKKEERRVEEKGRRDESERQSGPCSGVEMGKGHQSSDVVGKDTGSTSSLSKICNSRWGTAFSIPLFRKQNLPL